MCLGLGEDGFDLRADRVDRPLPLFGDLGQRAAFDQPAHHFGFGAGQPERLAQNIAEPCGPAHLIGRRQHQLAALCRRAQLQAQHRVLALHARTHPQDRRVLGAVRQDRAQRAAHRLDILGVDRQVLQGGPGAQALQIVCGVIGGADPLVGIQKKGRDPVERGQDRVQLVRGVQPVEKGAGALEMTFDQRIVQQPRCPQINLCPERPDGAFPMVQKCLVAGRVQRNVIEPVNRGLPIRIGQARSLGLVVILRPGPFGHWLLLLT